jgi:hypothetical protein
MAKMYTLDEKLLVGVPEIRIGEKVYKVDDREKTVKKVMALYNNGEKKDIEKIDEMFKPAAAKEISEMNMPWAAYQKLSEIVISAMTGQEDTEQFHE